MKIYEVFSAHETREVAMLHCRQWYPFRSRRIGIWGFYQERGWEFIPPGRALERGRVYCEDVTKPEITLFGIERDIACVEDSGDLLEVEFVGRGRRLWCWAQYWGLATRVSAGCFVLPHVRKIYRRRGPKIPW